MVPQLISLPTHANISLGKTPRTLLGQVICSQRLRVSLQYPPKMIQPPKRLDHLALSPAAYEHDFFTPAFTFASH